MVYLFIFALGHGFNQLWKWGRSGKSVENHWLFFITLDSHVLMREWYVKMTAEIECPVFYWEIVFTRQAAGACYLIQAPRLITRAVIRCWAP
jgi:hypothetical protein